MTEKKQNKLLITLGATFAHRLQNNVPLASHTTFEIGGPARWLLEVSNKDKLLQVWQAAAKSGVEALVLGEGSNVLVDDTGFPGLVILNRTASLAVDRLSDGRYLLRCGSGLLLRDLVKRTVTFGMAGLESLSGIPGTVGGAVFGNAGAYGRDIGSTVRQALVVTAPGKKPAWLSRAELDFSYRNSRIKTQGGLIVAVELVLNPGKAARLATRAQEILESRWKKLPHSLSAGSYFKNLPPLQPGERHRSAGLLLEQAGAKDLSVGDAAVFEKHANIIINRGRASSRDVLSLAVEMKKTVLDQFGISLEEEVRYVGGPDSRRACRISP
jgi:UDP-N-acetylmuramate dehydrogenase